MSDSLLAGNPMLGMLDYEQQSLEARKNMESLFEKNNNPGFFERYIQPLMNSIISALNTLIGLFTTNKQSQFTYFKTNTETLQATWHDIRSELAIATNAAEQMNCPF